MESILYRAERLEQDALVSAFMGYLHGVGGFPQRSAEANFCIIELEATGAVKEAMALRRYFDFSYGIADIPFAGGTYLFAQDAEVASALQRAGLFNYPAYAPPSDMTQSYLELGRDMYGQDEQEMRDLRVYVQAVARGWVPPDQGQFLHSESGRRVAEEYGLGVVVFHAATMNQQFPMKPQWDSPYVTQFICMLREHELWPEALPVLPACGEPFDFRQPIPYDVNPLL